MFTRVSFYTFDRVLAALVFLAIVLACALTPMQTDTWWQLRAGRDMWASRSVLLTDVYSHTAYGTFWPNHEWLAEVVFYALYRVGGFPLLTLFATGLIVGGWILSWRLAKGAGSGTVPLGGHRADPVEPLVGAAAARLLPVVHLATVFLIARRRLWWLPLIFVVWANFHGGVLLGFVLLGAGLGAQTLLAPGTWRQPVLVFLACLLAATATPLGLAFWSEIPKSLARISLYPLDEWRRPRVMDIRVLPFWIIAATFCYGLVRNRHRLRRLPPDEATLYACALALLPMAVSAIRNVGPFVMIAAPALTSLVRLRREPDAAAQVERPLLNAAVMAIAAVSVVVTIAWAYVNRIPKLQWAPVPPGVLVALRTVPITCTTGTTKGAICCGLRRSDECSWMDGRTRSRPRSSSSTFGWKP